MVFYYKTKLWLVFFNDKQNIYVPPAIEANCLYTANWINNNLLEPIFLSPILKLQIQSRTKIKALS